MNISQENIDDQNAVITINLEKKEVSTDVEKVLRDYRRKANVPGFRPGMVPMGMIKKMYGNSVMVDELNKKVSESLQNYFEKENLNLLGDPLPSESQDTIDIENQDSFDFKFDIAISPEFELSLTKRDKLDYYKIEVGEEMINEYVASLLSKYGNLVEVEKASDESLFKGEIVQLNSEGGILENGIKKTDATISLRVMKDDKIKKEFLKATNGQIIQFDLKKAYPNDTEISSLLDIDKEKAQDIEGNFQLTVAEIKNFEPAELNEEVFKQTYGEEVKTEEEFRARIASEISGHMDADSRYKFLLDTRVKLIKKLNMSMPEPFLKRWVISTNKELTTEQIDNEFPRFVEDLQWMLIKGRLAKENEIKIEAEDVKEEAKKSVEAQFKQYGMSYVPAEYLDKYADEILNKEEERKQLYEKVLDEKVLDFIFNAVKINEIEISQEDFRKLFE